MPDLADLSVFERVAALKSFSQAARSLALPKSTVSRSIARLEQALGTRLIQRTTRDVALTQAGDALAARCRGPLGALSEALEYVGGLAETPRGRLRVSCGIGWAVNVLADQLPDFARTHPLVDLQVDVTSRLADLVQDKVDVAIRLGPVPVSTIVAVKLGSMSCVLCAAPSYLEARGTPADLQGLAAHDFIVMPSQDGRPRIVTFEKAAETMEVIVRPRIEINEALTIHRLVKAGLGIGIIANYLCMPDIAAGRLVNLLSEWTPQSIDVTLVFPSRRELAPAVRAFIEFMKKANGPDAVWNDVP